LRELITIAVDAMGGDHGPTMTIPASLALIDKSPDLRVILVGDETSIRAEIPSNATNLDRIEIVHASQTVSMDEAPSLALRTKKDSSIRLAVQLVKDKRADACVSAGNTGAMSVSSILGMGRIKGVARPTLTAPLPNGKGGFTFLSDVGAFVDSKPQHLLSYAKLSSLFVESVYGINNPSVGLLNVGEEEEKGYELTTETAKLLESSNLNYYGNVEGKDIFKGTVDLIICDGFIGNILLKFAESIIPFLKSTFKNYANESLVNKIKIGLVKSPLKEALRFANYENHGGLPLLGVNGISIIGHGSSSILAIKNMVLQAKKMYDNDLINKFNNTLSNNGK